MIQTQRPFEDEYKELQERYDKVKSWLSTQGIYIPIEIEPYTQQEYESRQRLPKIYWTPRDHAAAKLNDYCIECNK